MLSRNPSNFHVEYLDVIQHWSPESEHFAGGDALVTAVTSGWKISPTIYLAYKVFGGNRRVRVYHCHLTRGDDSMYMPVLHNPYVNRILRQPEMTIRPLEEMGKPN